MKNKLLIVVIALILIGAGYFFVIKNVIANVYTTKSGITIPLPKGCSVDVSQNEGDKGIEYWLHMFLIKISRPDTMESENRTIGGDCNEQAISGRHVFTDHSKLIFCPGARLVRPADFTSTIEQINGAQVCHSIYTNGEETYYFVTPEYFLQLNRKPSSKARIDVTKIKIPSAEFAQTDKNVLDLTSKDQAIKRALNQARLDSALYTYHNRNSYLGFCTKDKVYIDAKIEIEKSTGVTLNCKDSISSVMMSAPLESGGFWCADSATGRGDSYMGPAASLSTGDTCVK